MNRTPVVIRSRSNPLLRRLRELKKRPGDTALLEGPKLVEEAAAAGLVVLEVAASPAARDRLRVVLARLESQGTAIHVVDDGVLTGLSEVDTSQGIVSIARRPVFAEDALYRESPLIVVSAGIQDPGNLGAVLRSAEGAGATGAYLASGTADPFSWKALRGSMGSAFRVPHVRGVTLETALSRLTARGVTIAATDRDGTLPEAADLRRPIALLLGNEGAGLPASVRRAAAITLAIPMAGRVESLNVAVAAGVLLFEAARQRRQG
jgi:TrmH family RNA methyltransferase